eukprot:Gregarina_sp_Poly_1__7066@NODE_385_length_9010_cov_42_618808_g314_i0_p3_GENE_NODE_385_length_9010_cov_42_618808_g314_i0NODE_385_length_9010_cov_42_618808_g314_i0_p3_ORF_typecomplete_len416_score46_47zfCCCH_3/PF15663_5/0_49zfCCCH_3/PF15663_5/1_5e03_NODE_385_length_9010_cov_42_618808_g314_i047235970
MESTQNATLQRQYSEWLASDAKALLKTIFKFWEVNFILSESKVSEAAQSVLVNDRWDADVCPPWMTEFGLRHASTANTNRLPDPTFAFSELPPIHTFPLTAMKVSTFLSDLPFKDGAVRREPFAYFYLPVPCPNGASCPNCFCPLAHSAFERMFHPLVYRSSRCDHVNADGTCLIPRCAFSHVAHDRISAENWWLLWESQWLGWRRHISTVRRFCAITTHGKVSVSNFHDVLRFRYGDNTHHRRASHERKLEELSAALNSLVAEAFPESLPHYPSRFETHLTRQFLNPLHPVITGYRIWDMGLRVSCLFRHRQPMLSQPHQPTGSFELTAKLITNCWTKMVGGAEIFLPIEKLVAISFAPLYKPGPVNAVDFVALVLCSWQATKFVASPVWSPPSPLLHGVPLTVDDELLANSQQ